MKNEVRICLSPQGENRRGEFQKNTAIFRSKTISSYPSIPIPKGEV
jgi:hypothetical protein